MKYKKDYNQFEFDIKMKRTGYLPFLLSAIFICLNIYVFAPETLRIENGLSFYLTLLAGTVLFLLQTFTFVPLITKKHLSPIYEKINKLNESPKDFSAAERTDLVFEIIHQPIFVSSISAIINTAFNIIFFFFILILSPLNNGITKNILFLIFPIFISAIYTAIFVYDSSSKICSTQNKIITQGPVDEKRILEKHHFGPTLLKSLVIHTFFSFFGFLLTIICISIFHLAIGTENITRIIILLVVQGTYIGLILRGYKKITIGEIYYVNNTLSEFEKNGIAKDDEKQILYDLNLDISYTSFLINKFIKEIDSFSKESEDAAEKILEISKKIEADVENSGLVSKNEGDDILTAISSMEKLDELMAKIENKFSEVAITSNTTLTTINESTNILSENMNKIEQITRSNIETISGIKELSDQIETVWSVISTIDSIAQKTRTIAFNAEIETSTLGDSAENFHIVANEIRRLADSVTDSTLSIREKITSIQHASDNLVITSEGGTEKIREESELFTNLDEKFGEIKLSGQVTDESTILIKQFLENQKESLNDLSKLLYDLNINFSNFKNFTGEVISNSSLIQKIIKGENENAE